MSPQEKSQEELRIFVFAKSHGVKELGITDEDLRQEPSQRTDATHKLNILMYRDEQIPLDFHSVGQDTN